MSHHARALMLAHARMKDGDCDDLNSKEDVLLPKPLPTLELAKALDAACTRLTPKDPPSESHETE